MTVNVLPQRTETGGDLVITPRATHQTAPSASSSGETYPTEPFVPDASLLQEWVERISHTASGLDSRITFLAKLWESDLWTTRPYYTKIREEPARIRPENRRAIELLDAWMSEPDDLGPDWWDEFDRELSAFRLSFRSG